MPRYITESLIPTVFGVGIVNNEVTKVNGKPLREYEMWGNLLERCYSPNYHKKYPTYRDCEASNNFKNFKYFKEWCRNQIGFGSTDNRSRNFTLDKDILFKGNKIYSENTCIFVPHEINLLFVRCNSKRGDFPIGVNYLEQRGKYRSSIRINGRRKYLGYYNSPLEAFLSYKNAKEDQIKVLANKWKKHIDPRAYMALCEYEVSIDD